MKFVKCEWRMQLEGEAIFGALSVAWRCIAPWSCGGRVLGQQQRNRFAQSTHARAWLAHGACKFYRLSINKGLVEGSLEVKLRTKWTDKWKSRGGKSQRGEEKK